MRVTDTLFSGITVNASNANDIMDTATFVPDLCIMVLL